MSMVYNDFDTFLEELLRESGYEVRVFSFRGITHIYMKEVSMYKGVLNELSGLEEIKLDKVKFFVVKGWALPWVNSVLNSRPSYKESVVSYFVRVTGNLLFVLSSAFMLLLVYLHQRFYWLRSWLYLLVLLLMQFGRRSFFVVVRFVELAMPFLLGFLALGLALLVELLR